MENQTTTNTHPEISADALPALTIEQFRALSPEQKRVAICRDALGQIAAQRFVANTGQYFSLESISRREAQGRELRDVILKTTQPCAVCAMGAVFASAVRLDDRLTVQSPTYEPSFYGDYNERSTFGAYDPFGRADLFNNKLSEFFDPRQTVLMEAAFERVGYLADRVLQMGDSWFYGSKDREGGPEGGRGDWRNERDFEEEGFSRGNPDDVNAVRHAIAFGDRFNSDEERLCAILQNVIDHDGVFVS